MKATERDQFLDEQEARYREYVELYANSAFYPGVTVVREHGAVWMVCANGHRFGTAVPESGCPRCQEDHRYRAMGRGECEVPGCHELVKCRQDAWDSGEIRKCKEHWTDEGEYVAGPVCLDELVTVLGQYNPRNRWNGWLMPAIDAWSVEEVLAKFADDMDYGYEWEWLDDGSLKLIERQWRDEDPDYVPEILTPDEDGLYALGAGSWTWSENEEFYDSEEHKVWAAERQTVWTEAWNAKNRELHSTGTFDRNAYDDQKAAAQAAVDEWEKTHPEPEK